MRISSHARNICQLARIHVGKDLTALVFMFLVLAILAAVLIAAGVLAIAELPHLRRLARDFREMR